MFKNVINFGKKVSTKDLYDAMQKSAYMQKRGYEILYANIHYKDEEKVKSQGGITTTKKVKGDILDYALCFSHDDEMIYIHIRILETAQKQTNEFSYGITLGDEQNAEDDLFELAREVRNIL